MQRGQSSLFFETKIKIPTFAKGEVGIHDFLPNQRFGENRDKNMSKVHPGHEVLSLFGMTPNNQVLNQSTDKHSFTVTLVSAFLIILLASLVLALATSNFNLSLPSVASASAIASSESVAYEPSQAVSNLISQGYLSR